jgi:hypothetical protein
MIPKFVLDSVCPIVEKRIKETIIGLSQEYKIKAPDMWVMLKIAYSRLVLHVFCEKGKLKEMPLNQIKGGTTDLIENHIKEIFDRDALIYGVHTAYVNYVFQLFADGRLMLRPNISGNYKEWMTLKQIL